MFHPCIRSCSGAIVTSYSKDNRNTKMLDKRLENILEQYKIFKNNLDLKFELSERPEFTGC